ncbi:hypothetical protein P389DRAFT_60152 [Cystobasidium minutum MCA 4210]|uniref:uncharacterized protein n=1 Tax=Cystobasidium minutum MCA 4210 TaxID=1397322 RepID=UPI0034CF366B|eukprot:jgi/Rhomi1/60152/CE60151_1829
MDAIAPNEPAAAAVTSSPRVKSPSYSPKLEDEEELKPDVSSELPVKAEAVSSADFQHLLSSLPSSSVAPSIQSAYDNLLSLYQYTLSRLQLLELIGANGVLTDALILRLQQLSDENDRLLESERTSRADLADLKRQLDQQQSQVQTAEAALNDAHQLLQQQEEELQGQTNAIQELKDKLAAEQKSRSRHTSSRTEESHRSSRRLTHDDSSGYKEADRARDRHREHRSHRSGSQRERELDRDAHRSERDAHRRERENSVASSRYSSSRRGEESSSRHERRDSRVERIYELEEDDRYGGPGSSRRCSQDMDGVPPSERAPSERRTSISGAAGKPANGTHETELHGHAQSSKTAPIQNIEEEDDYEPEIDLGEDLIDEPTVKPGPVIVPRARSRSRERERNGHHRETHHSSSSRHTRSRSPTRHRIGETADTTRGHSRDDVEDDRYRDEKRERSPIRSKRDTSPPRGPRADERDAKRPHREPSSSATSRSRNTSMYGRLGLPISGSGGQNSEAGGRPQMAIRGAGRSTNARDRQAR